MLDALRLSNYTIVDNIELVCGPGLNVLTGETGAGKSIIVDALNLLLGARGSTAVIRPGAGQAELEGIFDLADSPAARTVLEEYDLPVDEQLVLRRVLTAAGKSRAYVNGRLVPLSTMAALRNALCDFHGQHDHQSLLHAAQQLDLLDAAAGLLDRRAPVAELAAALAEAAARLDSLREQQRTKAQRAELLREDLERFEAVALQPGAEDAWRRDRDRLANADELHRVVAEVAATVDDSDGDAPAAADLLRQAGRALRGAAGYDDSLTPHVDALAAAQELATDTAHALLRYLDGLESDPAALEDIQQRLHALDRLKRRYGVDTADELLALRDACAHELAQLENIEHELGGAEQAHATSMAAARDAALALSETRATAAATMAPRLTKEIRRLGMPDGELTISLAHSTAADGELEIDGERVRLTATGVDRATILFSANRGMPQRPLRDVASGGELSRIMLALKAAQAGTIPLLVFDEIDAGIGGNVGIAVADKLVSLAKKRQVFCVTHLPQIAARAHTHWQVEKHTHGGNTVAHVEEVRDDARAREVARMFGDAAAPKTALEHAHALLNSSR